MSNLIHEIDYELAKHNSVNKKSLVLSLFQKLLDNKSNKEALTGFFKEGKVNKEEFSAFLNSLTDDNSDTRENRIAYQNQQTNIKSEFPVRTFIIASHIYLELHNNEMHYESLIRDTSAMQEFIKFKFQADNLSKRLLDMKNFNYKNLLKFKNNSSVKGQLKPQFKQIARDGKKMYVKGSEIGYPVAVIEKILGYSLEQRQQLLMRIELTIKREMLRSNWRENKNQNIITRGSARIERELFKDHDTEHSLSITDDRSAKRLLQELDQPEKQRQISQELSQGVDYSIHQRQSLSLGR